MSTPSCVMSKVLVPVPQINVQSEYSSQGPLNITQAILTSTDVVTVIETGLVNPLCVPITTGGIEGADGLIGNVPVIVIGDPVKLVITEEAVLFFI